MAIVAQQQTDPEKAKISSIWEVKDTTKKEPMQTSTPSSPVTEMKIDAPKSINPTTGEMFNADWTAYTWTLPQVKAWSYYRDVYLPKVQAEKLKKQWQVQNIETPAPTKAQTMDTNTLSVAYEMWDVSATDLENLKQTDPLKYQEAKLAIERKRTLDAINQTWSSYLTTQKQLFDSYIQKWDEISWSDEWKTLREEVFAKYGLDKSNEKIQQYATQIDEVDAELESLSDWTGTGDALADRGEIISRTKALTKQRNDLVKLRANEMDYYKLWLEQADAVAADYKEYKAQELAQLGVRFEMMTGMSKMEFEMKDKQNRDYLADVDKSIGGVQEEIKAQQELERNVVANTSLLSLYDEFSDESKIAMAQLDPKTLELVLKKVDETNKNSFEREMKLLWYNLDVEKHNWDMKKYGLESKKVKNTTNVNGTIVFSDEYGNVVNSYTPWAIESSWLDITQIVDFCTTNRWRSNVQCGELVNDYWKLATGAKMWIDNTFASKVQAIQNKWESPVPMAGGVFAYDVGTYWHTGIITNVFPDGTIETLEANIDGTELWSPPVTKKYWPSQYASWTFSKPPQNNKIIEENAKAMLVGIWGTEWEREEYARMLVQRAQQFWWDLKKAKADLWLLTKQDQDFIETRKTDIQNLKKSTFWDLMQARRTYDMVEAGNWNGITDTAAIIGFLKTIDPTSVARETEVASVQNAVSAIWAIENKILQAGTGKKLNDKQRQQIQDAMKTIISAADRKYSDAILDYIDEFETRGIDYTNYITTVDMSKVINAPVTKKDNIQYWVYNEAEYEQWLYKVWPQYDETDYLF